MKFCLWGVLCALALSACVSAPAPIRNGNANVPIGQAEETTAETMDGVPNAVPPQGFFVPDETLHVCPISVRNAPPSEPSGFIPSYGQLFVVDGRVALATVPVNGGCLSSGYGIRGARLHKGIDISAPRGTWIYSAGPGIVREAGWGGSFGFYILIDHGYGVYTRYAHLDALVEGLEVGSELGFGWPIGQVGNSSTQNVGIHLHYEVLTGDYSTPKKSFGLEGNDPFGFPVYAPPPIA